MKIFKLMAVALVAMVCFSSCEKDCGHDFIEHDFTQEIVGTWTFLNGEQAEAMVIKADGSFTTTGIMKGGALYEEKGTIKVVNNKVTLAFDGDKETFEGRLEFVAGKSMSIVMFDDNNVRLTYDYCENDLSDEIVGMWVCNEGLSGEEKDMGIITYSEDGKAMFTGNNVTENNDNFVGLESTYKVVGDILFQTISYPTKPSVDSYMAIKLTYAPNGTSMGDILTQTTYLPNAEGVHQSTSAWLRIKQSLDLAGQKYDYIKTFVTNVKGLDKDINFMGFEFNFAKMDGVKLDKMLKTLLFAVEFPTADSIKYSCHYNGEYMALTAPIAVDGNKMTVKMSDKDAAYKDVDLYTFQDADCSQMHMYMPTYAFINFFGNMQATMMSQMGQLDLTNAEAVKAVFDSIDDAVETINVSFVMEKAAK